MTQASGARPGGLALVRQPRIQRLLWCSLVGFAGFAVLLSALPLWAVRQGIPAGTAGLVTTTVTLAATVATQFAVPAVVARVGIGPALAAALVLLGAPAPAYLLATTAGPLAAVSAVRGVGFGLLTVIGSLLVALLAPRGAHGSTAGLYGLSIALPTLLAVPGAVLIAQQLSFTWVFALAALPVLGVPAALAFGKLGRRGGEGGPGTGRTWRPAAARAAAAPTTVLVVVTLAGGGLFTFVPIGLDGEPGLAPVALLVLGAAAALGRWAVGAPADRHGPDVLLPAAVVATAVGAVAVAVALAMASSGSSGPAVTVLVAGSLAAGAGYGAVQNLTLVQAFADAGPGGSATASTVWNAGYDAGTAAGAAVVGAVAAAGAGIPAAVGLTALPVLAVLPVTLGIRRRRRTPR